MAKERITHEGAQGTAESVVPVVRRAVDRGDIGATIDDLPYADQLRSAVGFGRVSPGAPRESHPIAGWGAPSQKQRLTVLLDEASHSADVSFSAEDYSAMVRQFGAETVNERLSKHHSALVGIYQTELTQDRHS